MLNNIFIFLLFFISYLIVFHDVDWFEKDDDEDDYKSKLGSRVIIDKK